MPAFAQTFYHWCMLGTQVYVWALFRKQGVPWQLEPLQIGCDSVVKIKRRIELSRKRLTATGLQSSHSSSEARETLVASHLVRCRRCWKALPLQRWFQVFQNWKVAVIEEGLSQAVNGGSVPDEISWLQLVSTEMNRSRTCISSSSCHHFFCSWPQKHLICAGI